MAKIDDFFDNEYNKQASTNQQPQWGKDNLPFGAGGNAGGKPINRKGVVTLLIVIALVVVYFLGILTMVLIDGNDPEQAIIDQVLETLRNDYLFEITDEEWKTIIADGGTAMLRAVDKYGMLLDPQTAYDLLENNISTGTSSNGYGFGFQFVEGVGMFVSSVALESNAFGRLQQGDIIVALDSSYGSKLSLTSATLEQAQNYLFNSGVKTFCVIRDGEYLETSFASGSIGSVNNTEQMAYVQYYFGDNNTNLSITTERGRVTSSKQYKQLGQLDSDIGYISLLEFTGDDTSGALIEMKSALQKFSQSGKTKLVLDLKGNPGGNVDIAVEIAGMLASNEFLTEQQRNDVTNKNGDIKITKLVDTHGNNYTYHATSTYSQYFSGDGNIVIWTDGNSASASELLTGALTEYKTAIQMGTKTYGKGIAQSAIRLDMSGDIVDMNGNKSVYNWCLYFTFANYYSPLGVNIHNIGYTPQEQYNNLTTYSQLVAATNSYFG